MRKIAITTSLAAYLASALISAGIFGSIIYITTPAAEQANPLPVINFANTNLDTGTIIGTSPFKAATAAEVPEMQVPPGVPSMPGAGMQPDVLTVVGVLPPDVVILQKGGESLTARVGTQTKWGTVNSVTASGATIDGAFINIK